MTYSKLIRIVNYCMPFLIAIMMPFYWHYIPLAIWLWLVVLIIDKINTKAFQNLPHLRLFLVIFIFIVAHLIAAFFSINRTESYEIFAVKLSLLIFPLFMSQMPLSRTDITKIFKVFVYSNIASAIVCLIIALILSLHLENHQFIFNSSIYSEYKSYTVLNLIKLGGSYFSYAKLSRFLHPSYFSMFLSFCIAIVFYRTDGFLFFKRKLLSVIILIFMVLMIILLSSRAGIITCFVLLVYKVLTFKKLYLKVLIIFILILLGINAMKNTRLNSLTESNGIEQDIRYRLWTKSFSLIKSNLWFGVTPGDVKSSLNFEEQANDMKFIKNKYS